MSNQNLNKSDARTADKGDPFTHTHLALPSLQDAESPPRTEVIPQEILLRHLISSIRDRVNPHEENIRELFAHLNLRRESPQDAAEQLAPDGSFTYRDPLYGPKQLPPWLMDLIDTAPMIRLGGVSQMTVGLTAHGAGINHTRLSHSIGAAILALETAERLNFSPRETKLVTALALFHDARHGPFSHIYDHVNIGGKKFDHDECSIDFLRADDVRAALDRVGFKPDEIAAHLKMTSFDGNSFEKLAPHQIGDDVGVPRSSGSPYGYLAKAIIDRVDYAQRDPACAAFFSEKTISAVCSAARSVLESAHFDRERNAIVFPASKLGELREFIEWRGLMFESLAFDPRTQAVNAFIRRELKRQLDEFTSQEDIDLFLETSTYMTDQELQSRFSPRGQKLLRSGSFEHHLASIVVIRAEDLTEKGRTFMRVPFMHDLLNTLCGPDFYKEFDPLIIRVPRTAPSITFYIQGDDGEIRPVKLQPVSSHAEGGASGVKSSRAAAVPADYGYREIRVCSFYGPNGDSTEASAQAIEKLIQARERIQWWLKHSEYILPDSNVVVELDDLQRLDRKLR